MCIVLYCGEFVELNRVPLIYRVQKAGFLSYEEISSAGNDSGPNDVQLKVLAHFHHRREVTANATWDGSFDRLDCYSPTPFSFAQCAAFLRAIHGVGAT